MPRSCRKNPAKLIESYWDDADINFSREDSEVGLKFLARAALEYPDFYKNFMVAGWNSKRKVKLVEKGSWNPAFISELGTLLGDRGDYERKGTTEEGAKQSLTP